MLALLKCSLPEKEYRLSRTIVTGGGGFTWAAQVNQPGQANHRSKAGGAISMLSFKAFPRFSFCQIHAYVHTFSLDDLDENE